MTAARFSRQLLAGPKQRTVQDVVRRLTAVQSQELNAARLSIRARSDGLAASDLEQALATREVVVSWLNRGTLHLVLAEDYPWLHTLTTPQLATGNERRLRQEGVSPAQADRGVSVIERALADGPRTRAELKEVLASADVPVAGQALVHTLFKAARAGICVRGPLRDGEQEFVMVRDWLPRSAPVSREAALRELGARYLAAHAPAYAADLAVWAGLSLREARTALAEASPVDAGSDELPAPTLLGSWDEVLMGWRSREWVLGGSGEAVIRGGMFRPVIVVEGVVVGTWSLSRGEVRLAPFRPLGPSVEKALASEVDDVQRFLST